MIYRKKLSINVAYADDNKAIAPICSKDDSLKFQDDINMLDEWSD
jgi:hypothetical protein